MPLIIICPSNELKSIEELFSEHDYFNFDHDKVSIFLKNWNPFKENLFASACV